MSNLKNATKLLLFAFAAIFFIVMMSEVSLAANNVVINEIMANPLGEDTGAEWIKLYNPTDKTIDLTGWQLNPISGKYYTFPALTLAPQTFVTIHWRADGADGASDLFTGAAIANTNIGNKSGWVALFKNSSHTKETIVDYVEYGAAGKTWESTAAAAGIWTAGEFVPAAEEGQTIKLRTDGVDNNLVSDWIISGQAVTNESSSSTSSSWLPPVVSATSSPSSQSETTDSPPAASETSYKKYSNQVFINEFLPWPSEGKEWVELNNLDSEIIDLSGWQIDDGEAGNSPQKISSNTLIEPNQLLVIELNKNILNNDGDQIRLLWPDNQAVHIVSYQKAISGSSCSRFANGAWLWTNKPTPGETNEKPVVATITPSKNTSPDITISQTVAETVNETKNESGSATAPIKSKNAISQNSAQTKNLTNQLLAQESAPIVNNIIPTKEQQKLTTQTTNSSPKMFLILGGIMLLGLVAGLILIYFKRRLTPQK